MERFYRDRGMEIKSVEVRSVQCKDAATQRILQEIIQEHTNRINRLQQQESENEVSFKKLQGQVRLWLVARVDGHTRKACD